MLPVEHAEPCARRALLLLAAFLVGCAVVAGVAALGLGTVWQDVYGWVHPQVIGTT